MKKIFNVDKKIIKKNYSIHWLKYFIPSLILGLFWYNYVMKLAFNNFVIILNMFICIIFEGIAVFSAMNVLKGFVGTISQDLEKIVVDTDNRSIQIYKSKLVNNDMNYYVYNYKILELQEVKLSLGYIKLIGKFKYNYKITSDYHLPYEYEDKSINKISVIRVLKDEKTLLNMINEFKN